MAEENAVFDFGVADVQTFYDAWVVKDPQFTRLVIRHLNHGIFQGNWTDRKVPGSIWLLSWGRMTDGLPTKRPTVGGPLALTLAELMAPKLPANLSLMQNRARAEFRKGVYSLIQSNIRHSVCSGDNVGFGIWVRSLADDRRLAIELIIGVNPQGGLPAPGIPPPLRPVVPLPQAGPLQYIDVFALRYDEFSFDLSYYVLLYLSTTAIRASNIDGITVLTNVYSSVMKRGVMTEGFKTKIESGVLDDLNVNVILDLEACSIFYKQYGRYITADNIESICDRWQHLMPEDAMRLRLVVSQAANSGLTALIAIGTAILMYPDFPWNVIQKIMPDDVTKYLAAIRLVNGNAYFGFNKDLGAAKSTLYKNLTYPAKELLIKLSGKSTLSRYAGWPRSVPHQTLIDKLVVDYEKLRSDRVADYGQDHVIEDHRLSELLVSIVEVLQMSPDLYSM